MDTRTPAGETPGMTRQPAVAAGAAGATGAATISDLGGGVYAIDTLMGGYEGIVASYLIRSERPCLVETGTALSAPLVIDALARLGVGPSDLGTILVTHIHLDHAGGVGDVARAFPQAQVVVHERGARHLVDPRRLLASAQLVYGDVLDEMFGPLLATDAERVRAVGDRGEVDLGGGRRLQLHHAPGHAQHHLGILDSETGDLYVGDAAGVWVPESGVLRPATPPPDFDLDLCLTTIDRFRAEAPTRLLFSHFGPVTEVSAILGESVHQLRRWVEAVGSARASGLDLDHAVARVRELVADSAVMRQHDPALYERQQRLNADEANVAGIWRWLDRQDHRDG